MPAFADAALVAGSLAGVAAVVYAALQFRHGALAAQGTFWLELRQMFHRYDEVHLKLMGRRPWDHGAGPTTGEEWMMVESYMGLFEHCYAMLEKRLIDWDTFRSIYGYRVGNIVCNDVIRRAKLEDEWRSWTKFIALAEGLGLQLQPSRTSAGEAT